jgi:hypothetical protein
VVLERGWSSACDTSMYLYIKRRGSYMYSATWIFRRILGYSTIVCALTTAFQWALVRPLELKTR